MSVGVASWWALLGAVAVINMAAWMVAAATLKRRQASPLQLLLSAGYVFGCAFRSFLPVYDIPRICLVDSWLSSVLVGRSVATVAELCFAAQWALFLHTSARATGSETVRRISLTIVPLIAIAELCSWSAVLTTANIGHVFENSLWGVSAALIVASLLALGPRWPTSHRPLLAAWCMTGAAYVAYMFVVDVPMYWSRWIADEAAGREYLSLANGVIDASACKLVSFRWEDWKHEVTWMTLYFSAGVWASISLIHARALAPGIETAGYEPAVDGKGSVSDYPGP
jgi:hypothetical protein